MRILLIEDSKEESALFQKMCTKVDKEEPIRRLHEELARRRFPVVGVSRDRVDLADDATAQQRKQAEQLRKLVAMLTAEVKRLSPDFGVEEGLPAGDEVEERPELRERAR